MCDGCWKDLEKMRREKWKCCLLIGLSLYFGFPASTSILPLVEESELIIIFYRSIFIVFSFHSFKFRYPSLDNSSNDDGDSSQTSLRIRLRAHLALNILHLHMLAIIKLLRYFSESRFSHSLPSRNGKYVTRICYPQELRWWCDQILFSFPAGKKFDPRSLPVVFFSLFWMRFGEIMRTASRKPVRHQKYSLFSTGICRWLAFGNHAPSLVSADFFVPRFRKLVN